MKKNYKITYTRNQNGEYIETDRKELPSNWNDYQKEAFEIWNLYSNDEDINQTKIFETLILNSNPIKVNDFTLSLNNEFIGDCDLFIDIKSNNKKSNIYFSSAENEMNTILWFLEALTFNNKKYYFNCSEEGPDSFIYVETQDAENVRFVHISNKKPDTQGIVTEPNFEIRQDFIIKKKKLISKFYNSLLLTIKNTNPSNIYNYEIDVFESMNKNSEIIENYIKNNM